jgi:hypothetical protein
MTRRGKATILLVVGLGALGFGAKLLYDQYSLYWPDDLPPTLAFYGGGLLAVAIALAIIKRPWVGAAVVVAGAGVAVAAIKLGQDRMAVMERGWAMEHEVGETAEKVCTGTANAAAAGTRGLMQVTKTDGSEVAVPHSWDGFAVPATPAEVAIVVCRRQAHTTVAVCDYGNTGGDSYQISKYQIVDDLTVYDAKTLAVLGTQSFEGTKPSDQCDDSVMVRSDSRELSHEVGGDSPSFDAETAFVRSVAK